MHSNIPYMFDSWANPVVNLLLLNIFMTLSQQIAPNPLMEEHDHCDQG